MSAASKTFRVFVSSTFSDLKAERNALQTRVFPELRALCAKYDCRFQAIDLRWGISEEASLDQQTMAICFKELERCQAITPRPNFIILLGNRYGWRPLPYKVDAGELEEIAGSVSPEVRELLLWSEGQPDNRKGWYRKDDNAVPAEYLLRHRRVDVPPLAGSEQRQAFLNDESKEWAQTERKLRAGILRSLQKLGWPEDDPRRVKYETSATHQEILRGALMLPDAYRHIYCFCRETAGIPEEDAAGDYIDLDESRTQADRVANRLMESLKNTLRENLGDNYFRYRAEWTGGGVTQDHVEQLCRDVYNSLSRTILSEIRHLEEEDPLEREIAQHAGLLEERALLFTGRQEMLRKISSPVYVSNFPALAAILNDRESDLAGKASGHQALDPHPVVVYGVSGSGKSSLMARAIQTVQEDNRNDVIVFRFIGATPGSSNSRALLESLCRQISRSYGEPETDLPYDFRDLAREFPRYLGLATARKPLTIFLDALDQLIDKENPVWLPSELPEHVRFIVSTTPGDCLDYLSKRLPPGNVLELQAMSREEGGLLLLAWLKNARRTLQPAQFNEVLGKFNRDGNGLPFYLKLAFEEACNWKSYTDQAETALPPDTGGIISGLLERLSSPSNHGQLLVSRCLGYIGAGKHGLTEDELLDLLSGDDEILRDFVARAYHAPPENKLPVVLWARLYLDLKPYLTEAIVDGTITIQFNHEQFRRAAQEFSLNTVGRERCHQALASYFKNKSKLVDLEGQEIPNRRALSELPYQQAHARQWTDMGGTLADFTFIETRLRLMGPQGLFDDYDEAYRVGYPGGDLRPVQKALQLCARILKEEPDQLAGQLLGRLEQSQEPLVGRLLEQAREWKTTTWLRPLRPSLTSPGGPLTGTLEGHEHHILMVKALPDGKRVISVSQDGTYRIWDAGSASEKRTVDCRTKHVYLSAVSTDGRYLALCLTSPEPVFRGEGRHFIKVWDVEREYEVKSLQTDRGEIQAIAILPDKTNIVYGFENGVLCVWNFETGKEMSAWQGHENGVDALFALPGDRQVASVGDDGLKVWDVETGRGISHTRLPFRKSETAVLTPDGRKMLFSGPENTIHLRDLNAGSEISVLEGHTGPIKSLSVSADGRRALSCSWDDTLRLWDLVTGQTIKLLRGIAVDNISIFPDGRRAVSSSNDIAVRLWDLEAEDIRSSGLRPDSTVMALAIRGPGQAVLSGHRDGTITVWNKDGGEIIRTLRGHDSPVVSLAVSQNRRYAISGSYDETARVWDLEAGKEVLTLRGHVTLDEAHWVNAVAFSPDGRLALTGSVDKTIKVWDASTGAELKTLKGHDRWVISLAVTPDGRRAVSGSRDNTIKIWDLSSGKETGTLAGHTGWVTAVLVLRDNRHIVSGSKDGTVRVWDLEHGNASVLEARKGGINAMALSPDGSYLVSGSENKNIQLWDLANKRLLAGLTLDAGINACAMVPDTLETVIADDSGQVHLVHPECLPN